VRISAAKEGDVVTIQGTVTSRVGLFDSDERRVTVQDGSGAILVRLPEGASGPDVGTKLRVRGEVGTWFAARQLEADAPPRSTGRGSALPVVLRRAPGERDEWRLVRVTVRITKVERDGDTWRAEASLGAAGTLPIVGLARSGISADALEEGRNATITGIVKRAHPSATDQRFGIAPRDPRDIRLGPAPRGETTTGPGAAEEEPDGSGSTPDDPSDPSDRAPRYDDVAIGTPLKGVPRLVGRRVRVAGALRVIDTPLLTLDDGSGRGLVRLSGFAPTFDPPLHLGEVINVTGTVATRDVGGWEIVASAEGVMRASRLTVAGALLSPSASPSTQPSPSAVALATPVAPVTSAGPGDLVRTLLLVVVGVGLAALVVLGGVLAVVSMRRRSHPGPARSGRSGESSTNERA
jgi:hypothetical protein